MTDPAADTNSSTHAPAPPARGGRIRRALKRFGVLFVLFYLLPVAVAAGLWFAQAHPMSWRDADWTSSGQLAGAHDDAEVRVYAARTGRYKGIVSVHTWIVTKHAGGREYVRYDKVGWGMPVRRNHWAADANWYSNPPQLLGLVSGEEAEVLIPKIEAAIDAYPYNVRGGYRIWPGPNSNSFTAYVLEKVPEIGVVLPPTAVGKDFPVGAGIFSFTGDGRGVRFNLFGLVSLTLGMRQGVELNLFGLVAGFDPFHPALKLPGLGRLGMTASAT